MIVVLNVSKHYFVFMLVFAEPELEAEHASDTAHEGTYLVYWTWHRKDMDIL